MRELNQLLIYESRDIENFLFDYNGGKRKFRQRYKFKGMRQIFRIISKKSKKFFVILSLSLSLFQFITQALKIGERDCGVPVRKASNPLGWKSILLRVMAALNDRRILIKL